MGDHSSESKPPPPKLFSLLPNFLAVRQADSDENGPDLRRFNVRRRSSAGLPPMPEEGASDNESSAGLPPMPEEGASDNESFTNFKPMIGLRAIVKAPDSKAVLEQVHQLKQVESDIEWMVDEIRRLSVELRDGTVMTDAMCRHNSAFTKLSSVKSYLQGPSTEESPTGPGARRRRKSVSAIPLNMLSAGSAAAMLDPKLGSSSSIVSARVSASSTSSTKLQAEDKLGTEDRASVGSGIPSNRTPRASPPEVHQRGRMSYPPSVPRSQSSSPSESVMTWGSPAVPSRRTTPPSCEASPMLPLRDIHPVPGSAPPLSPCFSAITSGWGADAQDDVESDPGDGSAPKDGSVAPGDVIMSDADIVAPMSSDSHLLLVKSLRRIIQRFQNIRNIKDIGKAAMRCAQFFVEVPSGGCYMRHPLTGELDMTGSIGFSQQEQREALRTCMDRHPGMVMREKRRLHISNTDENVDTSSKRKMHVRSRLWLPLFVKEGVAHEDKVLGAMGFASPEADYFTKAHIEALEMVVDLVAMSYSTLCSRLKVLQEVGKYVSPNVAKQIAEGKDGTLGGAQVQSTMMFVDIRNFTRISEALSPNMIVSQLNSYFTQVSEAIYDNGGMVDKFMGDGMMAVFGVPDNLETHEFHACGAALAVLKQAEKYRKTTNVNFFVGIGLSTGEVLAGNIGCPKFMSYTVIGDSVNLAARLESLTKKYGVNIIVGPETYRKVANDMYLVELDKVRVVGKSQTTKLYHLVARSRAEVSERMREAIDLYCEGYPLYSNGNVAQALHMFVQSNALGYAPGKLMAQRCASIAGGENPLTLDGNWNGVWEFDEK